MGVRIGTVDPKTLGIICRHRTKTRRGWNLCPRCHTRYIRIVAPEKLHVVTEKRREEWREYARRRAAHLAEARLAKPTWPKRDKYMRRKYGITIYQFNQMVEEQEGRCKICLHVPTKFQIDHCHKTGRVRGLLCWRCNRGLGFFYDVGDIFARATKYLRSDFDARILDPQRSVLGHLARKAERATEPFAITSTNGEQLMVMTAATWERLHGTAPAPHIFFASDRIGIPDKGPASPPVHNPVDKSNFPVSN